MQMILSKFLWNLSWVEMREWKGAKKKTKKKCDNICHDFFPLMYFTLFHFMYEGEKTQFSTLFTIFAMMMLYKPAIVSGFVFVMNKSFIWRYECVCRVSCVAMLWNDLMACFFLTSNIQPLALPVSVCARIQYDASLLNFLFFLFLCHTVLLLLFCGFCNYVNYGKFARRFCSQYRATSPHYWNSSRSALNARVCVTFQCRQL